MEDYKNYIMEWIEKCEDESKISFIFQLIIRLK